MKIRPLFAAPLLALAVGGAGAQLPDDAEATVPPDAAASVPQSNGVKYLNGGASEEDRDRMQAQRPDYPVRIALSGPGGEYVVAERLTLSNRAGAEIASVAQAGPVVMFNLPPGQYSADVTLPGGKHQRRSLRVGSEPLTLDWSFAQAPQ